MLANDTDADGDDLTAVHVAGPSNGSLALNADGSFAYIPNTEFYGTDMFSYKANDGERGSEPSTVTITVVPHTNQAPVSVTDNYSADAQTLLTVGAPGGVLANDTDPDGDTLTAIHVAGPFNGSLALNADGSFAYTPNAGFSGTDTFSYIAHDGQLGSEVSTVTITVADTKIPVIPNNDTLLEEDNDGDGGNSFCFISASEF